MSMNARVLFFCAVAVSPSLSFAQAKIIDMHIHSYDSITFAHPAILPSGEKGSSSETEHFRATYKAFADYHIITAVVSGSPESVEHWVSRDIDHRVVRGIALDAPGQYGIDSVRFEALVKDKKIQVFGEVGAFYEGTTLADKIWEPYLRICERYDIPVAVHTGGGPPEATYTWAPRARLKLSDPFLIEDVLVKYPRLRVYLMHSGEVWYEHAIRLMVSYPKLYTDVGVLLWAHPLTQRYAIEFLKSAKDAHCLDRVMFGTDQMRWPQAIGMSIKFLNGLSFLTAAEKENIFYNNAMRFLRLERKPQ